MRQKWLEHLTILQVSVQATFIILEAPPRFELGDKGFADPCLTTWLWLLFFKPYRLNVFKLIC